MNVIMHISIKPKDPNNILMLRKLDVCSKVLNSQSQIITKINSEGCRTRESELIASKDRKETEAMWKELLESKESDENVYGQRLCG